jgi:hypothetical protein
MKNRTYRAVRSRKGQDVAPRLCVFSLRELCVQNTRSIKKDFVRQSLTYDFSDFTVGFSKMMMCCHGRTLMVSTNFNPSSGWLASRLT